MQEMRVQFLGQEDPLEEGMATSPVFLPRKFHGQRRMAGYSSTTEVSEHSGTEKQTRIHLFILHAIGSHEEKRTACALKEPFVYKEGAWPLLQGI